ncbi:MAG: N-acetylneuraminate synthase family protein [Bacteroidota bacterium]
MYNSNRIRTLIEKPDSPVYIICEIGINHNGSLAKALELIDAAKEADVDAVKFQKRSLPDIYGKAILKDANSAEWNFDYMIPLLKEYELSEDDYRIIRKKCDDLELDLIITPFDLSSAEFVAKLGVSAFKIASADMTNLALVEKCGSYGLPVIISTGMWEKSDIETCVKRYKDKGIQYILLHAQSTYPSPYESLNLKFIEELKKLSNPVGFSGHERGTFIPIAAVAMGCKVIEKHITFDRNEIGPDHKASMLPEEWKDMVHNIRMLEKSLGARKEVNQAEKLNREVFAKSAVAKSDIKAGHILVPEDVELKSPGKGIFPHEIIKYYGQVLKNDVKANHYIAKTDFENVITIGEWKLPKFSSTWGIKCRFHDFEAYNVLHAPSVEFHCSQTDLDVDFRPKESPNPSQLIVHAPEIFDRELFDICSDDETKVKRSLHILQRSIDKTLELAKYFPAKKPKMVIHLGGMSLNVRDLKDTRPMMDNAIRNFKPFHQYKDDLDILPENLPSRPWYFGGEWYQHGFATAEDMRYFCETYGLGMTYDICHAFLYCQVHNKDIVKYTETVMPIVKHLHLSDARGINGEGVQLGEGEMNLDAVFDKMKGYKDTWVTEIWSGHLHNGAGTYKAMQILGKYDNII